jgi:dGTPase
VLDGIYPYNVSLQTLSGIASHDGELELAEYYPQKLESFEEFDALIEDCYLDKANVRRLVPSTLEGCVMRISDIIAYLGKDRQDAMRAKIIASEDFDYGEIGNKNAEIINNLVVNIIENSYGKPYIKLDGKHFEALSALKQENYSKIYLSDTVKKEFDAKIRPMMCELYEKLLSDLNSGIKDSPIFTQHIDYVNEAHYARKIAYEATEPNQIVVDYIASMTDDYFIDLHRYLFPDSPHKIEYHGYFDEYRK